MNFKKLTAFFVSLVSAFSMTATVMAASSDNISDEFSDLELFLSSDESEDFVLVSRETADEGDGIISTTYLYLKDDGINAYSDSQEATYYIYKKFSITSLQGIKDWVSMNNKGKFTWNEDSDEVKAEILNSSYLILNDDAVIKKPYSIISGVDGKTGLLSKKYAYISQSITMSNSSTSDWGMHKFELWVQVDVTGKVSHTPDDALFGEV